MGMDFIRQRAKTFTRSWDYHRLALCERSLFTVDPECRPRTAVATITKEMEVGRCILVRCEGTNLNGYDGLSRVASFVNPPPDLLKAVQESGGCAEGTVVSVIDRAVVEVTIC